MAHVISNIGDSVAPNCLLYGFKVNGAEPRSDHKTYLDKEVRKRLDHPADQHGVGAHRWHVRLRRQQGLQQGARAAARQCHL